MAAAAASERHIVIAVCGSEKKHRQSFDKLRQYVRDQQAGCGVVGRNHTRFSFVNMRYEPDSDRMSLDVGDETDVDVVLQKVSTLPPKAAAALQQWCAGVTHYRTQQGRAPVVLMDSINSTHLVLARSSLQKILDRRLRPPRYMTPRSWLCLLNEPPAMPLGVYAFLPFDGDDDDDHKLGDRWWILKTDLSTGPDYSHHMIVWRGDGPESALPEGVRRLLPAAVDVVVVQEFYADALPVVVKVYCVGPHIWAKAVPTGAMTQYIHSTATRARNTAVLVDSQQHMRSDAGDANEAVCWERFLAEGGQAHEYITRVAEELMEEFALSLFGFDLLLVPPCNRGIGAACIVPRCMDSSADMPTRLFDDSGAPTARLCKAIPVVIDVNYFPGYGGMPNVNAHLIELIESRVEGLQNNR